jgi:hypothetical protein
LCEAVKLLSFSLKIFAQQKEKRGSVVSADFVRILGPKTLDGHPQTIPKPNLPA